MTVRAAIGIGALLCLALQGCNREEILPGQRYDVRTPLGASLPEGTEAGAATPLKITDAEVPANRSLPIRLPAATTLASWPQRGANAAHRLPNLAIGSLTPAWTATIGQGNDRRHRITADPVHDGSRIFTLDSHALVMAHSLQGQPLWQTDLTPASDHPDDASGGGLAVSGGVLYVTSGFGTVTALDAATGKTLWTQAIGAVGNAAPTVVGDMLYVMGRDGRAWGIRSSNGKVVWEIRGAPVTSSYVGGAGAAVDGHLAVLPFASDELIGVLRLSGTRSWSTVVSGQRRGEAYAAAVSDFASDPVLVGNTVYAANSSGRTVALKAGNGERMWTAQDGALGQMVVAGGSVFLASDDAELVRLDAETGERIWGVPLPNYVKDRPKKRKAVYANYGPILVGGRLMVASSDGVIRLFDPVSGATTAQAAIPGGAASNPIVVGGVTYIVNTKGQLVALR